MMMTSRPYTTEDDALYWAQERAEEEKEAEAGGEPLAEVRYETLARLLGTVDSQQPAPEYGERAWRVQCPQGAVVYWDTGNSWCAIMQVEPRPGEEAWAQHLTAQLKATEDTGENDTDLVPCSDCGTLVEPDDPYYATPCGTFCGECMDRHMEECGICRSEFR